MPGGRRKLGDGTRRRDELGSVKPPAALEDRRPRSWGSTMAGGEEVRGQCGGGGGIIE